MNLRLLIFLLVFGFVQAACDLGGSDVGNPNNDDTSQAFEDECNDDVLVCSDGTILDRDPDLDCDFPLCPDE